jgi:hypothetical protein
MRRKRISHTLSHGSLHAFPDHIYNYSVNNSTNKGKSIFGQAYTHLISILIIIVLLLIEACGCKQTSEEKKGVGQDEKVLPRPAWISQDPLVFVGNWDSELLFRHRRGGDPLWQEEDYIKQHTEENVLNLKDMGVTMAILHFYKGFGIEAEKEHMEDAKKLAALCKKHGIKVGVYIGSTVGYETILLEKPEAAEWFVPDYLGNPVRYFWDQKQTFRKMVYFMHPGFIEYMKQVLRIAIEDLKVDLIHFDNTSGRAIPATFHHPMAVENFRTYLRNKYAPEMLKKRLGFSDVRYVEPPSYERPLSTIDDPLFQEWADFRCQQLADFYGVMGKYIHSLNPEVAVENNPAGATGTNSIWLYGVDHPKLLSHTDFFWSEEGNEASVNNEGVLISKIRSYKLASTLNNRVFTYTSGSKLLMAECMAYNRQIGMVGGLLAADNLPDGQRNYIKFFLKNFNYYHNINNVADVAILNSYATMAFNNDRPYQSTYLFEQALIQEKIPFDIIFDGNLKDLSKYRVLVLADQECLSDEKLELIRNFVDRGGGLVATEHSSLFTEWRQRRLEFGLNDLFHIKAPEWQEGSTEAVLNIPIQKNQGGKGRVVYIPEVQPSIPKPPTVAMTSRYWKLPVNWKDLIESVQWASGNSLSLTIEAPLTVTMEFTQKEDKSALILHLLNFDSRIPSVKNIKVDMQVPDGKRTSMITVLTPDGRSDEILRFKENGKRVEFTVPELSIYNLILMKLE